MMSKRGQGLSLNVIIIAVLALIVLVVLVFIFTGRIGLFDKGVGEQGQAELVQMRIQYGDCHPTLTVEKTFTMALSQAQSPEAKETATSDFEAEISDCKANTLADDCSAAGCTWK